MEDAKRATGRTTRMILKVVDHLIKYPNTRATIVCHNCAGIHWMKSYVASILSDRLWDRITYIDYRHWQNSGIGKRDDHFFDHHCFHTDLHNLRTQLVSIERTIARLEKDANKYDL